MPPVRPPRGSEARVTFAGLFFDSWVGVVRIIVMGVLGYLGLILLLRISGKRTLSKMSAFDFVITIAFGSVFANVLMAPGTALAEGVTALAMLVLLQFSVTWLSVRSRRVESLVKAEPALIYYDGRIDHRQMKRERITQAELHAAVRSAGLLSLDSLYAVVLETNGDLTVLRRPDSGTDELTLEHVKKPAA